MKKKNAIVIGDITRVKYHPLKGVDDELSGILEEEFSIQFSEDYEVFNLEKLKNYDLCISYVDCWDEKITPGQTGALLAYVGQGGGLLVIHNGISLQNRYELCQMIGAKFTGHPPMTSLNFRNEAPQHPIMIDVEAFEIVEEPYRFEFDNFTEKTILLAYEYEGVSYPAGWTHEFGEGRIVYLAPGHQVSSFKSPEYRKVILKSGLWAARNI
ncbi:MAG: ThuA domain-containing protein [Clostridia bacterium]|nr:ThuA domain-containing protein [Clostridia bacterium]